VNIEVVADIRADLGESPVWDERYGQLWWVDALAGRLYRRDVATGAIVRLELSHRLGGLALGEVDLVAMLDTEVIAVPRDPTVEAVPRRVFRTGAPLHDCGVAPDGAIWVGTLSPDQERAEGGLLRLGKAGAVPQGLVDGYRMPNGISWTADGGSVHVVDSLRHAIFRSRFADGREVAREPWVIGAEADGLPDGVCADLEGGLWVAYWGTGRVVRYDTAGRPTCVIEVPARYTTSCCFGGPGLRQLFITSARYDSGAEETEAGALFVAEVDVPGLPVPTAWRDVRDDLAD